MSTAPRQQEANAPGGRGPCVVLAGGGTAGHIEPALALGDAVRRKRPDAEVVALGTERGLEQTLVPARGYRLELVPPVPMPRKPGMELARLPMRVLGAVRETKTVLRRLQADVLAGFGGYVSLPAYLAARATGVPIVVHETNIPPGLANRIGARLAARVATANPEVELAGAEPIGIPLRDSITGLDRAATRAEAREYFGLDPQAPTLLAFGGSQGARSINDALAAAAPRLAGAGIGVLHAHGPKNTVAVQQLDGAPPYVAVPYLERMDLAYAAADAVLCRCGAMTVAEVSALGLPAVYVPLPHGNGEQANNARPAVDAGAAELVQDAELSAETVAGSVVPMLTEPGRLQSMSAATKESGHAEAADVLADMVLGQVRR